MVLFLLTLIAFGFKFDSQFRIANARFLSTEYFVDNLLISDSRVLTGASPSAITGVGCVIIKSKLIIRMI
jgi:hypothetical protein